MRNPFTSTKARPTRRRSKFSLLNAVASSVLVVAGLGLVATGTASAVSIAPHAATGPCNISVTGAGTAVPSSTLIVGVVAGTTQITFDCNTGTSAASAPAVVAEASLLAAIGTSNVLPTGEADTSALGTFAPAAADTGCPAGTAGSCSVATFAVPATFTSSDPNGVCPPTQAQINAGLFGCAIAVANASEAEITGAEYLIQYASQTTAPNPPTIAGLQSTGAEGSQINVSDAAGNTGYWWGNGLEAVQALEAGSAGATAPSTCGASTGYGNVPTPYLADVWFITGTTTPVGGGVASGVTISNDCYDGKTLNAPVLGGTITVPATVTAGAKYTVYLCEVNFTPYPSNDANSASVCGAAAPSFIDASFSFTAAAKVISQNLPQAGTVTASASSSFTAQLTASGNNGTVAYAQTAGTPSLVVSATGAVTTSGALKAGSYTASGTTSDASGDTGTFTYTLTVTGAAPPVTKPAPKATRVDGYAIPGRTVVISILGRNFTAKPKIIGHAGTVATALKTTATKITVRVREVRNAKKGTFRFTIQFASGKKTSIAYRVK
jgi:hypothetical protein